MLLPLLVELLYSSPASQASREVANLKLKEKICIPPYIDGCRGVDS